MENTFTPKDSLETMRAMIAASREQFSEGAVFYLLWGWLVLIAAISHYILIVFTNFDHPYIAWPILMFGGGIASFVLGKRLDNKAETKTYIDRVMTALWGGAAGPLVFAIVMGFAVGWHIAFPVFIAIYGWGTFTSGQILKFRPLVVGGVLAFVIAIVALFTQPLHQLLLIALAILVSYLIPGYMLKARKNR